MSGFLLTRGARVLAEGGVRFEVWAPAMRTVELELRGPIERRVAMAREGALFSTTVADAAPGQDYSYLLDGERRVPDPISRHQPEGVHGPSRVVDPSAFAWRTPERPAPPLAEWVFYELHTGTFTPGGTFDAAIERLPHLVALGVTAVELMPVAEFPGARNWGYDGVCLYAPHSRYGGPDGLRRLVDACHAHGLAVVLDVVYNHLGPEGNYLHALGPYFADRYHTPWGETLNFDGAGSDEVRRYVIDNALYWLAEYQIDALRLDAVHGIFDFSARHVLEELGAACHAEGARRGRPAYLIAESDLNDVRVIAPVDRGGWALDAQWSDDFHHAAHGVLTGDRAGYFADFGRVADLAKALRDGFVYDGRHSPYRQRRHGAPLGDASGAQLVVYLQNHDQIPNASHGRRLSARLPPALERLGALLLACTPNLPFLFMGQEFSASTPFLYFTSHGDPALAEAVTRGRLREHQAFGDADAFADPQAADTFERSRLDWRELERAPHDQTLRLYQDLLALRRRTPALSDGRRDRVRVEAAESPRRLALHRGADALLVCAFDGPVELEVELEQPLVLALASDDPRYGGAGASHSSPPRLAAGTVCFRVPGATGLIYVRDPSV